MNSKIGIKNIFYNRLHNKSKSKLSNTYTISSSNINNSYNSYDKNKSLKINTSLYFKPRPIYIIPNENEKHNICINKLKSKKPQEIETYEVEYSNGNITLTKINTERNIDDKNNIGGVKKNNNSYDNKKYKILRNNSYEFKHLNDTLNIRNYFNYKYEQIKKSFNLDRINTYNFNNSSFLENKTKDNLGDIYLNKKIKNNTFYNLNNSNNNDKKNDIKLKSSKSADIVKLCKFLKDCDYCEKGTLIKDNDEGGIIDFKKDNLEAQKQKYKYNKAYKKIVLIQKWWKKIKFKRFYTKFIIIIQKIYRGYIFRKKMINYIKPNNLEKILFIQECWKRYLMKINKKKLNFSLISNDININSINNNESPRIGNKINENKNIELKVKSNNNSFHFPNKNVANHYLITKKSNTKINQQINNINLIKKNFNKYSSLENQNQKHNDDKIIVYFKKNLHDKKQNKSRKKKKSIIKSNIYRHQDMSNDKSLSFISGKNYYYSHSYNTPNKQKNSQNSYKEKESTYSTMFYKLNCKEIFSRHDTNTSLNNNNSKNLSKRELNHICFISKNQKKIHLLNKIIYLQKEMKKYFNKSKYKMPYKNNICYISKLSYDFNIKYLLKDKIIPLQRYIKNFLIYKNIKFNKKNRRRKVY